MKTTALVLTFLLGITIKCGAQVLNWAKSMGGSSADWSNSIAIDGSGNTFIIGAYEDTVDFDPGSDIFNVTSAGNRDIFISKLDPDGNFIWAKSFGGISADFGYSLALDGFGNIYITGYFYGIVDFDPGVEFNYLTSEGLWDIFIAKLDTNGNFIWARSLGGPSQDQGRSIAVDSVGNVYTVGDFFDTADFDPGIQTSYLTSEGEQDIFISKLDSEGNFIWAKRIGGIGSDRARTISVDNSGNSYIVGNFFETVDFDSGEGVTNLTSAGESDIFILKLDQEGNIGWVKQLGGAGIDTGDSIALDSYGNIYSAGAFEGIADFDPGMETYELTSEGHLDIYIVKLDTNGNLLWAKGMGSGDSDYARSICTDDQGGVYTTGQFGQTVDFDPGMGVSELTSSEYLDIFISKLDSAGNFLWAKSMGGSGFDYGRSIKVDSSENVYVTGQFGETADFDPGEGTSFLSSVGSLDVFISKLSQCIHTSSNLDLSACDSLISPSNNYTWTSSGIYLDTIPNIAGCDSLITINLTINTVDTGITNSSPTLIANAINASYQWFECNNSFELIPGATSQTFTATENGLYAVEITDDNCTNTSDCVEVTNVSILENKFDNGIAVFPNPTREAITITFGTNYGISTITVTNPLGEVFLKKSQVVPSLLELNLPMQAGLYFIEISGVDTRKVFKVLKQ